MLIKDAAVVVSDVEVDGRYRFERRMFGGSNPEQVRSLAAWLLEQEIEQVVMESPHPHNRGWGTLRLFLKV
jgi:hypothetical protein